MIITREVNIKINNYYYKYYSNLGYNVNIGDIIKIPVELLPNGSHVKITCKCDKCGVVKNVIYKNYIKYKNNYLGEYYCRKCSEYKRKETLKKKYGVEYPKQCEYIKNKIKKVYKRKKD